MSDQQPGPEPVKPWPAQPPYEPAQPPYQSYQPNQPNQAYQSHLQLQYAPPAPASRSGRGLSALLTLGLVAIAALGGGVAGAWMYAQTQDGGPGTTGGVTAVVDAPQLDYTSLASIASEVSPSVVQIQAGDGSGSGVIMSADGYILTNAHVVEVAQDDRVLVRFSTGDTATATVVGADARSDIAVVRAEGVSGLAPARFGDSDLALVGDTVLAIGSPLGFQGSVTQGILSARDRTLPVESNGQRRSLSGMLQTDASINPGNSGGPLVNLAGEVVGINTAIATDGEVSGFLGLGFAVPSNRAVDVAEQLIDGQDVRHAFLGVLVTSVDVPGALIQEVNPGSPADEAGLSPGDLVLRFGDERITDSTALVNAVHAADPGETLEVEFERDGSTQTTSVTLVEAPD